MSAWKRTEYEVQRERWRRALQSIAERHGKDSWAYKALGSLAWGRFINEPKPDEHKDDIAVGYGYLRGYRDACLRAAELARDESERDFVNVFRNSKEQLL